MKRVLRCVRPAPPPLFAAALPHFASARFAAARAAVRIVPMAIAATMIAPAAIAAVRIVPAAHAAAGMIVPAAHAAAVPFL